MPAGINIPKAALVFAATGSALIAVCLGLLVLLLGLSGSPDFALSSVGLNGALACLLPLVLALFCWGLLRRYSEPMQQAGRDGRASLTALVWLVDLALAFALSLYFLVDASTGARYRGVLIDPALTWSFAALAFAAALAAAWSIARSLRGLLALGLLAILAIALEASEALDVWLGVDGL